MPRTRRLIVPGVLVHVRCRFVDGRFEFDDAARRQYLERLDKALTDSDWTLLCYALMSSHIHLGLIAGLTDLESWLHPLNTAMAGWLSARRRFQSPRTLGPVFGDRPGTNLIPLERAFGLIAYQHNNPVEAGVVELAHESCWTSHRQYLGCETQHVSSLDVRRALSLCEMDGSAFDCAVNRAASRPTLVDGSPTAIVATVSGQFGLPIEEVAGGSKSQLAVLARRVALVMGESWGHSCARMAIELRISRAAAAKLRRSANVEVTRVARELAQRWRVAG